jgi:arsenite-transporting ATPase
MRSSSEQRWRRATREAFADRRVLELPKRAAEPSGPADLLALAMTVRPHVDRAPHPTTAPRSLTRRSARGGTKGSTLLEPSVSLVLVGGKGGVGKTTVASALAIELAQQRRDDRVLVLSTDPAHSLGDALATELSDEPRRVHGGPTNLLARELDAPKAWEAERARYRTAIDELFASIFRGKMDVAFDRAVLEDMLDLAPPGIDELLALLAILDALVPTNAGAREYDVVVVDTAPTGHTLRLLALPEKALDWVHALMEVILKYRSVIGLGELASDLTQLARRLRALIALLADAQRTAFVVIARPTRLPRVETERLVRELRRLRVPISLLVINAVTPDSDASNCARCASAVASEASEISLLRRAVRAPRVCLGPAALRPPRGADELEAWRGTWAER